MTPRRLSSQTSRRRGRSAERLEWIGGRLSPPFFIEDRDEPYRAEMVLWMEAPSGRVLGQEVLAPEDVDGALGRLLRSTLERPAYGSPRQPGAIRVADALFAAEVRAAVGDSIPITVAPTPELDAVLEALLESIPGGTEVNPSYLAGGRIAPEVVENLFWAASILYAMAPWKVAEDDQVLRMDIPALGVEGACVSIIGHLEQERGVVIFPSLAGYEAFGQFADEFTGYSGRIDLGSECLTLTFCRGAELPAGMRREAMAHGWRAARADAYPRVERRDRDGSVRPLVERDMRIAAACAASLSTLFLKYSRKFEADDFEPVCESYFNDQKLEVRFTLPYEAFPLFGLSPAPEPEPASSETGERLHVGRNDPCPCGSGRKYKKCHLPIDEKRSSAQADRVPGDDLEGRAVKELTQFAMGRFGSAWRGFMKDFTDASEVLQLSVPWSIYHYRVEGTTVLDRYLEEHGLHLSRAERAWLAAQQASWLSVWEVTDVNPGISVSLRDLISDETRHVEESTASRTLIKRDALLGRVVDHAGTSLLCGMYPFVLPPAEAAEVVRRAKGRLRRKRAVPMERLRNEAFGRYLIRRWEEAVAEFDERPLGPRELTNTDGDPFLLTTDHFVVAAGARAFVESQLASLEGVQPPDPSDEVAAYTIMRPGNAMHPSWENTVIGEAHLSGNTLRLETNSCERADDLRKRVEVACGDRIRHRAREFADPLSSAAPRPEPGLGPEPASPEAERLVLEVKRRHYADWLDQPVPALDGRTPREASRTAQGRAALDTLLKGMENREQRAGGGTAFDFTEVRKKLRLE